MRYITVLFLYFAVIHLNAQEAFIRVNEDSIDYSTFQELYGSNIKAEGLRKAMDTYVEFTLLNQYGKATGVDTTRWFKQRLNQFESETFKSFTTDSTLLANLLATAFDRAQTERKVRLFNLPVNNWYDLQEVQDQYQSLYKIHKDLCDNNSQLGLADRFDKEYKRKASFVSPFQFNKEMEDLIYNSPMNECSNIERFNKGWAFVKVEDSRKALGNFYLAHIHASSRDSIQLAFNELEQGRGFKEVVQRYTIDKTSLPNGGRLPVMNSNIKPEIYEVIKYLNPGDYSIPVKIDNTWHIFKLLKIQKCSEFKTCAPYLKERILNSDWVSNFDDKLKEEALANVPVTEDKSAIFLLKQAMGSDFFNRKDSIKINLEQKVWTTPHAQLTLKELANYFDLQKAMYSNKTDLETFFSDTLLEIKESFLLHDYMNHFEDYNKAFAKEISDIKKVLRVNYVIEKDIYYKAAQDSIGLQNYLFSNADKFTWPTRYKAEIYRTLNAETQEAIYHSIENGLVKEDINNQFGQQVIDKQALLFIYTGKLLPTNSYFPKQFSPSIGLHSLQEDQYYYVINIIEEIEPQLMSVEEAGPILVESYKNTIYLKTIKELKDQADIQLQFVQ